MSNYKDEDIKLLFDAVQIMNNDINTLRRDIIALTEFCDEVADRLTGESDADDNPDTSSADFDIFMSDEHKAFYDDIANVAGCCPDGPEIEAVLRKYNHKYDDELYAALQIGWEFFDE
jgi:hypothetical protein